MNNKKSLYLFAVMLVLYEFTTYCANDMIMPGMLNVVREFNAPISNIALSLSIFILGACTIQLFIGILTNYYGQRAILISGNFLFLLYSLFIALSVNINLFMIGRFLQGSTMAFIAIGYSIIHANFNDRDAVKLTALMGNVAVLAPLIGPIIGGSIISYFDWRYVFILSAITGTISLIGLIKYTPKSKIVQNRLSILQYLRIYFNFLKIPSLLLGIIALNSIVMVGLLWIAVSPTIILKNYNLPIKFYYLYQVIAVGGFFISSIFMQFIAGRIKLIKLIVGGALLIISGIIVQLISYSILPGVAIGMGIFCIGEGTVYGLIIRIIGTYTKENQTMLFSLMALIQCLILGLCLEVVNWVLNLYHYSLLSFVMANLIFTVIGVSLLIWFIYLNKAREWE